jgi:hypothetical protein
MTEVVTTDHPKKGGRGNNNDRNKANKEDIKTKFLETGSGDEDEENEQERTEGDNKEDDKRQEDCEMSNASENVS